MPSILLEKYIKYINIIRSTAPGMVHSTKGGGQLNIRIMGLTLIQFLMLQIVCLMSFSISLERVHCPRGSFQYASFLFEDFLKNYQGYPAPLKQIKCKTRK